MVNKKTKPYHEVCDIENEGGKMTWLRLVSDKKGEALYNRVANVKCPCSVKDLLLFVCFFYLNGCLLVGRKVGILSLKILSHVQGWH